QRAGQPARVIGGGWHRCLQGQVAERRLRRGLRGVAAGRGRVVCSGHRRVVSVAQVRGERRIAKRRGSVVNLLAVTHPDRGLGQNRQRGSTKQQGQRGRNEGRA